MAKTSGLGVLTLSIDDAGGTVRAIKNDFTNFQFSTPYGVQDVTGVDKSAIERLLLLQDFTIEVDGPADFAATTSSHAVFSGDLRVGRTVTIAIPGTNTATMTAEVLFTDYAFTRAQSGELTFKAPGVLQNGVAPAWS